MLAQGTRTAGQAITASQSLAAIQTMLKAGLGCITFLRNLLPDENFSESHLTTADDKTSADEISDTSFCSMDVKQRRVNGFKIMSITRDYSDEADKILNYLEYGIFHALQKQYLRSFIFAIYLDSKDPNNIVEAYTFNFQYHKVPGTDTTVPIMSLGDGLRKMNLKDKKRREDDPVAAAAKMGKAPTLRDVKKSVKTLLKTLIHATTQMDDLPKRRFATFKVFYTDDTPPDYEPPHFQAGDEQKDKWFFMTHDLDEVPDKWNIGKVDTGHHSVNLNITSIATYLPSSTDHDDAAFAGTTSLRPNPPALTPIQEATLRAHQIKRQNSDANERNVVWSVEDGVHDMDGECEDDPDYRQLPDGSYEKITSHVLNHDSLRPIGMRNEAGEIEPLPPTAMDEAYFIGTSEPIPTRLDQLNSGDNAISNVEQTQVLESLTQDLSISPKPSQLSPWLKPPRNDIFSLETESERENTGISSSMSSFSDVPSKSGKNTNGDTLNVTSSNDSIIDEEMLDLETQPQTTSLGNIEANMTTPKSCQTIHKVDHGLNCECGISIEDESCYCDGDCGRWYHVWCMGYHSIKDPRVKASFTCFDCRVRADTSWELIKVNLYPKMLSKFQDLALFRRAIKIAEKESPETPTAFAKLFGSSNTLARQLFKRLETEGFIEEQSTSLDGLGFTETRTRNLRNGGKTKTKPLKNRKNIQQAKYKFNRSKIRTAEYADYFNPNVEVEERVLCLKELYAQFAERSGLGAPINHVGIQNQSQTQNETQMEISLSTPHDIQKRANMVMDNDENIRPTKKVKISVAHGVDLAE